MKFICFELSMPNIGSWNGKWSGEGKIYAVINRMYKEDLEKFNMGEKIDKNFYYTWDDGWSACVSVRTVNSKEANVIQKSTNGFMGYNWMIESILKDGYIHTGKAV